jgi:hypothetical protein
MEAVDTRNDPCAEGWLALRRSDWPAARCSFEEALAAGEAPDAYEGLSWAAWWLDDEATVFAARERAYSLYRLPRANINNAHCQRNWKNHSDPLSH